MERMRREQEMALRDAFEGLIMENIAGEEETPEEEGLFETVFEENGKLAREPG